MNPHDVEIHYVRERDTYAIAQMDARMTFLDRVMKVSTYPLVDVAASFARKFDCASVDYDERAEFLLSFLAPEACVIVKNPLLPGEEFYAMEMRRKCVFNMSCDDKHFRRILMIMEEIDQASYRGEIGRVFLGSL